jgi:heat shock protein HslJ
MRALILTFLLTGCSLLTNAAASASLDGDWRLQAGTDQGHPIPIVAGSPINLKIAGTQAGGIAACNHYGGRVRISGSSVSFSEMVQTEMACLNDKVMASEAAYLAALSKITKAERSGDSLVLSGPQVQLSFAIVPPVADASLVGTTWLLDSLINGAVASSTVAEATLVFNADGTLAASTGCRDLTGRYTISGDQVQVNLDPWDTIACANPLGDQDVHVMRVLSNGFSVAVSGESLRLTAGDQGLGYVAPAR